MTKVLPVLPLLVAMLLPTGCTPTYTNLTPRNVSRNVADVYHFEVEWDTNRRGANSPEVAAYVVVDENLYPMQRVPGTGNRWEAKVPMPAGKTVIPYRYKFDYTYPAVLARHPDSDISPQYFLDLSKGGAVQP